MQSFSIEMYVIEMYEGDFLYISVNSLYYIELTPWAEIKIFLKNIF